MPKALTKAKTVVGNNSLVAASRGNAKAFFTIMLASALLVIGIVTLAAPGPSDSAQLWVDQNGGSCERTPGGITYSGGGNAASCATLDAAWDLASAGDVIRIKAGTYPAQGVNGDKTAPTYVVGEDGTTIGQGTAAVCRDAYAGQSGFCSDGAYLNLENITIFSGQGKGVGASSLIYKEHITWRNVNIEGQYAAIGVSGAYFSWIKGRHGAAGATLGPIKCHNLGASGGGSLPIWLYAPDALFDGLEIRPRTLEAVPHGSVEGCPDDKPHIETFRFEEAAHNITIKNTHFVEGSDAGSGHLFGSTPTQNLTLINNYFGAVNGTYWIQYDHAGNSNWKMLYNTFTQPSAMTASNQEWVGNLGVNQGCSGVHIKNVWSGSGSCQSDTYVGATSLGIGVDGRIASNSPARDAAETPSANDYCTGTLVGGLDIDDGLRPQGAACDAGADEFGSTGAPTRYVATTGSDTSNDCTSAGSPCATIGRAYSQAAAGDIIEVAAGTYGNASMANRSLSGSPVVIRPASGATVNFTNISVDTSNITLRGPNFNVRNFDVGNGGNSSTRRTGITFDGLNVDAQDTLNTDAIWVGNTTGFNLKNSRVGNTMAGSGSSDTAKSVMTCAGNSTCHNIDMTFENNLFYDADTPSGSQAHLECIWAGGVQGFTLRNNTFRDCTIFDVFITVVNANNQPQPTNHIFENNSFGQTVMSAGNAGGFGVSMHGDVDPEGFVFRGNTFEGWLNTGEGNTTVESGDWQVIGNIIAGGVQRADNIPTPGCRPGVTFSYNVMPTNCGSNTAVADYNTIRSGFASPKDVYAGADDFHLLETSPAIGKGDPADAGRLDAAGMTRGNPPDAGAYEYVLGGPDSTAPTNVTLTAPSAGTTLVGNATLTATAQDNVGVAGIQFKVDGNNVGSEDTSSPFSISWNSNEASNGSHTITAVARDAAGNTTTSAGVGVNVNNPQAPSGTLLLGNQTVEALGDAISVQQTQAWPFTAVATGSAGTAAIYLDATSTAQGVQVGLYSDSSGSPGSLLAIATVSSPVSGWNYANFSSNAAVGGGTNYWIAALGTGSGSLVVRDRSGGPCVAKVNAAPNDWTSLKNPFGATGGNFSFCPASVYVTAASSSARAADINQDNVINIFDLSILLSNYGRTSSTWSNARADVNNNGTVDIFDLSALLSGYGT